MNRSVSFPFVAWGAPRCTTRAADWLVVFVYNRTWSLTGLIVSLA